MLEYMVSFITCWFLFAVPTHFTWKSIIVVDNTFNFQNILLFYDNSSMIISS